MVVWLQEVSLCPLVQNLSSHLHSGGPKSALGSAIACGILLGVFEGVGVLLSRVFSEGQRPQMAPREYPGAPFCFASSLCGSTSSHDTAASRSAVFDSWVAVDATVDIFVDHPTSSLIYAVILQRDHMTSKSRSS